MSKKKKNTDVLDRLLEQEWAVTEDGKEIVEMLVTQIRALRKLNKKLRKQIKYLDENQNLRAEIELLRNRVEELEGNGIPTPRPGLVMPPAVTGVCTPSRGAPLTGDEWTYTDNNPGGSFSLRQRSRWKTIYLNTMDGEFEFENPQPGNTVTLDNGATATYDGGTTFTVTLSSGDTYRTSAI